MRRFMRVAWYLIAAGVCLLSFGETPKGQECLATGDVDCSGGDITSTDLGELYSYLSVTFGTLACAPAADLIDDCVVDWRDLQELSDLLLHIVEPGPPEITCCDPILIYCGDTAQQLGASSVVIQENRVIASGIGMSGADGVRIYPNMGGLWQHAVSSLLDNISLTGNGTMAEFSFTGAGGLAMGWPFPDQGVDTGIYLDHAVVAGITNTGGQVELTVDFLDEDISEIGIVPLVGGAEVGSYTLDGSATTMIGDLQSGGLAITGFSLSLGNSTVFTIQLDRPIEFAIDGQSPPVVFSADELKFVTVNLIQLTVGVGPVGITAANLDWFSVSLPSCCQDRVGDANGLGGDEPSIGDASAMIDAKFISGSCDGILECIAEADVNQSGGSHPDCDDITIGDISALIDYLFITGSSLGLAECL